MTWRLRLEKLRYRQLEEIGIIVLCRGHNGLKSIFSCLKTNDYEKIKIGVGRPDTHDPEIVAQYVLGEFTSSNCLLFRTY
jgi:peptidyl-tRNA hydrolase